MKIEEKLIDEMQTHSIEYKIFQYGNLPTFSKLTIDRLDLNTNFDFEELRALVIGIGDLSELLHHNILKADFNNILISDYGSYGDVGELELLLSLVSDRLFWLFLLNYITNKFPRTISSIDRTIAEKIRDPEKIDQDQAKDFIFDKDNLKKAVEDQEIGKIQSILNLFKSLTDKIFGSQGDDGKN